MTVPAIEAARTFRQSLIDLAGTLTDAEWIAPTASAGWNVRDTYAHLGASARNAVDALPLPPEREPLPENRERQHDVHVAIRRDWTVNEVVEEFTTYTEMFFGALANFQEEPAASNVIEVPGLGSYPMHALANAMAFDYYTHLYYDISKPAGMIDRELPAVTHDQMYAVVQWMMWGLPQMQGPELDESLLAPITFRFTGPGESTWTVTKGDDGLLVAEEGGADITVTSSATDFVVWGTARAPWRDACTIDGDRSLAIGFLSTLDII